MHDAIDPHLEQVFRNAARPSSERPAIVEAIWTDILHNKESVTSLMGTLHEQNELSTFQFRQFFMNLILGIEDFYQDYGYTFSAVRIVEDQRPILQYDSNADIVKVTTGYIKQACQYFGDPHNSITLDGEIFTSAEECVQMGGFEESLHKFQVDALAHRYPHVRPDRSQRHYTGVAYIDAYGNTVFANHSTKIQAPHVHAEQPIGGQATDASSRRDVSVSAGHANAGIKPSQHNGMMLVAAQPEGFHDTEPVELEAAPFVRRYALSISSRMHVRG